MHRAHDRASSPWAAAALATELQTNISSKTGATQTGRALTRWCATTWMRACLLRCRRRTGRRRPWGGGSSTGGPTASWTASRIFLDSRTEAPARAASAAAGERGPRALSRYGDALAAPHPKPRPAAAAPDSDAAPPGPSTSRATTFNYLQGWNGFMDGAIDSRSSPASAPRARSPPSSKPPTTKATAHDRDAPRAHRQALAGPLAALEFGLSSAQTLGAELKFSTF